MVRGSPDVGELLSKGEVLHGKVSAWLEASTQGPKSVEHRTKHRGDHARFEGRVVPMPWQADCHPSPTEGLHMTIVPGDEGTCC